MVNKKLVVVISGGSRGLGSVLISRCLKKGYRIATFSRTCSDYIKNRLDIDPEGKCFFWNSVDLTDEILLKKFIRSVVDRYGKIDVLVNNVGIAIDGILTITRLEDIKKCIDFNLKGTLTLTQLCCKVMLRQKFGNIVNISSVNAIRGHSGVATYSATKAAIDGLTRSLARELGHLNIRVNSIAPGYFESDMVSDLTKEQKNRIERRTPLGRLAKINEIVDGIMFMLSSEASFITGQTLVIDGGITC